MERYSADFYVTFKDQCTLLALKKRAQVNLIWWLPYALIKGIWLARNVEVIHLGDGVLAWLGVLLHWFTGKPISITLHGLDVTYKKYGYQKLIWSALKQYQAIICVSEYTRHFVETHCNASLQNIHVIPNGVPLNNLVAPKTFSAHEKTNQITLLTVGRLVPRKGVAWFIEQVFVHLDKQYHYVIIGSGVEYNSIQEIITQKKLGERVQLLGRVNDEVLHDCYAQADLLIMPNIKVDNNPEGFGIVALEAGACGLPVLAADLEGIRAAVIDGQTGFLVKSGSPEAWKQAIETQITQIKFMMSQMNEKSIKQAVQDKYSWDVLKEQYLNIFNTLM